MSSFDLGFVRRKYPAAIGQINMTHFDAKQLLGPGTCFPSGDDQVFESLALDLRQDFFVLIGRKKVLPAAWRRLFDVLHWVSVEQSQAMCPTVRALNRAYRIVLVGARPIRMPRGPAQHVVR